MFIRTARKRVRHDVPGTVELLVGLEAEEVAANKRAPIAAMLVLDVSSSMGRWHGLQTKFDELKQAVAQFVEQLSDDDYVGVVVFHGGINVLVPIGRLDDAQRKTVTQQIANCQLGAGTNLLGGLKHGQEEIEKAVLPEDAVRRLVLFTDGCPTSGTTNPAGIIGWVKTTPLICPITTIGFGTTAGGDWYDPDLLTAIAAESGGNFYHADPDEPLVKAFKQEIGALKNVTAEDVSVLVRPGVGAAVTEVLNDFPAASGPEGTRVQVGTLYGGETQYVVVGLELPGYDRPFPREIVVATVAVAGKNAADGTPAQETHEVAVKYVRPDECDTADDELVSQERARLLAGRLIAEAARKAEAGDRTGALDALRRADARVGSVKTVVAQQLQAAIGKIVADVADEKAYARRRGQVRAASTSVMARRTTNTGYTDSLYASAAQREATEETARGSKKRGT